MEVVLIIAALVMSIILHEMAHGYMANWLGDPTARLQGRLSGNPIVHIDPIGSVVVPALLYFGGTGLLFGWAKPVPYNPYNLKDQRYGEAKVAAAGPLMNIAIAIIFAVLIRVALEVGIASSFVSIASYVVYINLLLAFFNMIPLPPLDGSKILPVILPLQSRMKYREFTLWVERYGVLAAFVFIFVFIKIFWVPFSTFVGSVFAVLTGIPF